MADDRLTLRQAAAHLGVSESAIRKRVERGTLRSEKGTDGRRYVYVDTGADTVADIGADPSATHERDVLISRLEDEVAYLREESRRKDEIIMQQVMTMRQLSAPAPPEQPEASETVEEGPEVTQSQSDTPGPQEAVQRPWWRRVFGG